MTPNDKLLDALRRCARDDEAECDGCSLAGDGGPYATNCVNALITMARDALTPEPAHMLTPLEFKAIPAGIGWWESYLTATDPGDMDMIILERFAWVGDYSVSESGMGSKSAILDGYNHKGGARVWMGDEPPTDVQRQVVAWEC